MGDRRGFEERADSGRSLLEMIVSLAILSGLLMMVSLVVRQLLVKSDDLKGHIQMLESVVGVEDFMRAEFQKLQFVPYCPEMLPPYDDLQVGKGLSLDYQDYLQSSVKILSPKWGTQNSVLNLFSLKGGGGASYYPVPRKSLQGIVQGSEILQLSGLLPTNLFLKGSLFVGDLTADLVGVRSFVFYVTDCQKSMVVKAQRKGIFFEIDALDFWTLEREFNIGLLHVYIVKEYLFYLQLQNNRSFFTIDFLDGQVFYRMPDIVDMRFKLLEGGLLSIGLLLAQPSQYSTIRQIYQKGLYLRELENVRAPIYREVLIGLEQ